MANNDGKWKKSWDGRRTDIDRGITQALGAGRSVDDAFAEVSSQARGWTNNDGTDAADYEEQFRDYFQSRMADLERGGALARQDNGSFYVNPEYTSGQGAGNRGTVEQRLVEGATSSRSSAGSGDPAEQ